MTKQQLLALLREAFNMGYESSNRYHCDIAGDLMNDHGFIDLVGRTNRVGDLELPDFSSIEGPIKAQAVMDAIEECKITTDRYGDICLVDELVANAYEQGKG